MRCEHRCVTAPGSSEPTRSVVQRTVARVILVNGDGHALLFCGGDPARPEDGSWWFTPGGGADPGETVEEAARRELLEETGLVVGGLGQPIREDHVEFAFEGRLIKQHQTFFYVRVEQPEVSEAGWTEFEQRTLVEYRWWSADDIRASTEAIYPTDLADILDAHNR